MCGASGILFGARCLSEEEIRDQRVLEVGSYDVNGSLRSLLTHWNPSEYIGVDIENGPGVDEICDAEEIVDRFSQNSFDVVISTELIEHTQNWKSVVSNMKNTVKPGGIILVTTRSIGFHYHGYPFDFWRYQVEDFKNIFSDFEILDLESDYLDPGVFLKARKPADFSENDLTDYSLYNVVLKRRVEILTQKHMRSLSYRYSLLKHWCRATLEKYGKKWLSGRNLKFQPEEMSTNEE